MDPNQNIPFEKPEEPQKMTVELTEPVTNETTTTTTTTTTTALSTNKMKIDELTGEEDPSLEIDNSPVNPSSTTTNTDNYIILFYFIY